MGKRKKAKARKLATGKTKAARLTLGVAVPEMLTPSPLADPKVRKKERDRKRVVEGKGGGVVKEVCFRKVKGPTGKTKGVVWPGGPGAPKSPPPSPLADPKVRKKE